MKQFRVLKADTGQRADIILAKKLKNYSRSSLQSIFRDGLVKLANKPVKPSQRLKTGQKIIFDDAILKRLPVPIDIPIIFEDKNVLVMNKPAGLLTHSKEAINDESTVAGFVADKLNDKSLKGNRAGIVHRLDRGTSGVIIAAKNNSSLKFLQKQFSTRQALKTYQAIVEGTPVQAKAIIDAPIGRNPRRPQTFKVMASGKPAQTEYRVEKSFLNQGKSYSLLKLTPKTGRTHQLRVHLAYIGHPIAGDNIYGKGDGRIMLHAESLKLKLPNSQLQTFYAPTPAVIKAFIK